MANILIIKSSLNPNSKSDGFADYAFEHIKSNQHQMDVLDLKKINFPFCDGGAAYSDPNVSLYKQKLEQVEGVFIAAPIYNYDVNAALKNFVELTGQSWSEKIIAMAFYAGGERSYMSALSIMNSFMLDFRCLVVPNFVYASDKSMLTAEDKLHVEHRLDLLLKKFISLCEWKKGQK